ncbi:MAG: hypothetical protein WC332_02810 [Clostridia bacterium]|jgi:hypothetical protein
MYKTVVYTDKEREYDKFLREAMQTARDQRESAHDEFSGLKYAEWYEANAKARNGYREPKSNDNEVRITTGTVMEKTNSIASSLINLNLEPNIDAYDEKGGIADELGGLMADLVKKSNELEEPAWEEKYTRIVDEYCSQGTIFTEEVNREFRIPKKTITSLNIAELDKLKWEEGMEKYNRYCETNLLIGLNVYLGNIKEPFMQKQPFAFTRKLIPREEAKAMFGKWSRWDNVPTTLAEFSASEDSRSFNNWTLGGFSEKYVEELNFYDKWNNNYMKLLNGVMMFPVKKVGERYSTFPLECLVGVSIIPIAKADNETISNFAYSRSVPSKNITDQALFDEFLRSMIIKTRQSYDPPRGNLTGQELPKNLFYPSMTWDNIDSDQIKPLIDATGVTPSEFNMTQFVKGIIDAKSVSPIFEGKEGQKGQTATEVSIAQRQSMKNMTLAVEGLVNYIKQRTMLRIYNVINTWTLPEKLKNGVTQLNDQYRSLTIDTELEGGSGKRIVKFTPNLPNPRQAAAESRVLSKIKGMRIQTDYVDPQMLKQAINYYFRISIVPTPKEDSALKVAQFSDFVKTSLAISQVLGVPLKGTEIMRRFAILNKEDPDKVFELNQQAPMNPMMAQGQPSPQGVNAQLQPRQLPQPTVNTMANA